MGRELGVHLRQRPGPADPQDASGKQVDLVSASVVVVGVIAGLLLCLLVAVVLLMSRYHRRKAQQMTQKYEEELTLTRENSIRRLHSHHADPRNQVCAVPRCASPLPGPSAPPALATGPELLGVRCRGSL